MTDSCIYEFKRALNFPSVFPLDPEKMQENEEPDLELEEQFIMRLPQTEADTIRAILRTKPEKLKKNLKIDLDLMTGIGVVTVGRKKVHGYLKKLPTIIESYKTNIAGDVSSLYKTADITRMLHCLEQPVNHFKAESPHGYSLPMKNVKTKRFRKTLVNPELAEETETVNRELYYLLSTDLQAVSSRFQIEYDGETQQENALKSCQFEKLLFGHVSSSDSDIDVVD